MNPRRTHFHCLKPECDHRAALDALNSLDPTAKRSVCERQQYGTLICKVSEGGILNATSLSTKPSKAFAPDSVRILLLAAVFPLSLRCLCVLVEPFSFSLFAPVFLSTLFWSCPFRSHCYLHRSVHAP